MIINVKGLDIKLTKGQLKKLEQYEKSRSQLVDCFKKQLIYPLKYLNYKSEVSIKDNIIYVTVICNISDNIYFDESVESLGSLVSKTINRDVVYVSHNRTFFTGMQIKYKVKNDEIKLIDNIDTLNDYVITKRFVKEDDLYEKNHLIIVFLKMLIKGIDIPDFKLIDKKVYYKDNLLMIINYLNDVTEPSPYIRGELNGYSYHIYLMSEANCILDIIVELYSYTHNNKTFQYCSIGSENPSWLVKDKITNEKERFKNWMLYLKQ
jgi:hypothetical protein